MTIPSEHPFRILLATQSSETKSFVQAISNAVPNTRIATASDAHRLEELLNKNGTKLPHLIFLDLVHPLEYVTDTFSRIYTCSVVNAIPVVIFTGLVPPAEVIDAFSRAHTLYLRKSQLPEMLEKNIAKILSLDWANYLSERTESIPTEGTVQFKPSDDLSNDNAVIQYPWEDLRLAS